MKPAKMLKQTAQIMCEEFNRRLGSKAYIPLYDNGWTVYSLYRRESLDRIDLALVSAMTAH